MVDCWKTERDRIVFHMNVYFGLVLFPKDGHPNKGHPAAYLFFVKTKSIFTAYLK